MKPQPEDTSAPRDLLRLVIGVAAGSITGTILGAAVTGYMQLLQETSSYTGEMQWVIFAVIVGGLGGAAVGAVVGLITSLILVVRKGSTKAVSLR